MQFVPEVVLEDEIEPAEAEPIPQPAKGANLKPPIPIKFLLQSKSRQPIVLQVIPVKTTFSKSVFQEFLDFFH